MTGTLAGCDGSAVRAGVIWPGTQVVQAALPPGDAGNALRALLPEYRPITLEQMEDVALLNRAEAKYVMNTSSLLRALGQVVDAYSVLVIEGQRLHDYRTLYFDTATLAFYLRHHAGGLNRYKVRAREYLASRSSFFEVKLKTNQKRVVKQRIPTPDLLTGLDQATARWLAGVLPYDAGELEPRLWNSFRRITLVNRWCKERVTIDTDIAFWWGEADARLPGIAVAEVKQEGCVRSSEFTRALHADHVRSTAFSKYCMGVSLLYPQVKHNRFKAKHLLLARLAGGLDGFTD